MDGLDLQFAADVEKIRLQSRGQRSFDYHANLETGVDAMCSRAAGVAHEQLIDVVRNSFIAGRC